MTTKTLLFLAFVPYLGLALYDGWLHEKARRVPRVEQLIHAAIAVSLAAIVAGLFFDRPVLVLPALACFSVAALLDELGYHRSLHRHERRLHFAAYACFAVFIGVAIHLQAIA
ncbi:MAG: hypothetical protein M3Z16_09520 [Pseudomonadota bacterium]|nr:hypothetical protein [Pseudomonadota bacterium]